MCNLYSITTNQDVIRHLFAVTRDLTGNLPPMLGAFPDYPAPIVQQAGDARELTMARSSKHTGRFKHRLQADR